jgi:hypothetical protein
MKPDDMVAVFKQVLDQHYKLADRLNAMEAKSSVPAKSGPPAGSGPVDTMLLGLHVAPIDTTTLADGTKLTYVKKNGNFQFL